MVLPFIDYNDNATREGANPSGFFNKSSFMLFDFTKLTLNVSNEHSHSRHVNGFFRSVLATLFLSVFMALTAAGALIDLPGHSPSEWNFIDRANMQTGNSSVTIQGGYAVNDRRWLDAEI